MTGRNIVIGLCLALLASLCPAATYCLDLDLATGNNDGSDWTNAWQTFGAAETALDVLGDDGAGDTVLCRGTSAENLINGVWVKARAAGELLLQADAGYTPTITGYLLFNAGLSIVNVNLKFDGFVISGATGLYTTKNSVIYGKNCGNLSFVNCTGPGAGDVTSYWFYSDAGGFDNLLFSGCSWNGLDEPNALSGYSHILYLYASPIDANIVNCTGEYSKNGIYLRGDTCTISDTTLQYLNWDAIEVAQCDDIIIQDCNLLNSLEYTDAYHSDMVQLQNVAMEDITIQRCIMNNSARQLLYANPTSITSLTVVNNLFIAGNNNSFPVTFGAGCSNTAFNNNIVDRNGAAGNSGFVYLYNGVSFAQFNNNIIHGLSANVSTSWDNESNNIYVTTSNITNIDASDIDIGVEADMEALFVAVPTNYLPVAGGAQINAGTLTGAPATDINGMPWINLPEIGCYRYMPTTWGGSVPWLKN